MRAGTGGIWEVWELKLAYKLYSEVLKQEKKQINRDCCFNKEHFMKLKQDCSGEQIKLADSDISDFLNIKLFWKQNFKHG